MIRLYILVFISSFLFSLSSEASHLMGGEMSWQCLDNGRVKFQLKLYRACSGINLPGSATINNPLAGIFGGTSTITVTRIAQNDLSKPCYNSGYFPDCQTASLNAYAMEEHVYESNEVSLNGTPDSLGSAFWWSSCCRPSSSLLENIAGSGYFIRARMYPYRDPKTGQIQSFGSTVSGASCYDSSPVFASSPSFALCAEADIRFDQSGYDLDGDSVAFERVNPHQSSTTPITWKRGYSTFIQFPNKSQDIRNNSPSFNDTVGYTDVKTYLPKGKYNAYAVKIKSYKNGQKVAEIFRDVPVIFIDCDTISSIPPVANINGPKIEFRPLGSSSFKSNLNLTVNVGSAVEVDIRILDTGYLPTNPISRQSVNLEIYGKSMSTKPYSEGSCLYDPCAYLDTNNTAWTGNGFKDTTQVIARFKWYPTCTNLNQSGSIPGNLNRQTHTFLVKAYDNYCPVPMESFAFMKITLIDTSRTIDIDTIDARNGVKIHWTKTNSAGFNSYKLYRSSTNSSKGLLLANITNINSTRFVDFSAHPDTTYYYQLRLNDNSECNIISSYRKVTLGAYQSGYPSCNLYWTHPYQKGDTIYRDKYFLNRKIGAGNWSIIDSVDYVENSYVDLNVPYDTLIQYYISTRKGGNFVGYSNIDTITIKEDTTEFPDGFKTLENSSLKIYPNPVKDILFLESEEANISANLRLYSSQGRVVHESFFNGGKTSIDVSTLKPGIYFVELVGEIAVLRKKILIN